ncbi:MAG: hypothetical protein KDI22_11330 [Gammaproteobacteria bacterium]|nr:hypothetical protein [Gammaproteobacteria bacterium]HOP17043.1 hypothetical protein [Gammaproteobacteria bacterium]HPQ25293.1 hypothetical protein [Gammaproteobacteria bacterium]
MSDSSAEQRMLLGTVGWKSPAWSEAYFPPDLPGDWRLAYYANDASCVFVPAAQWCDVAREGLAAELDELPRGLVFFLEAPPRGGPLGVANLDLFAAHQVVLLVEDGDATMPDRPQWVAQGPNVWADTRSDQRLVRWMVDTWDLRRLRSESASLDERTIALVIDGPAANPGRVPELRTLLQLLGRA